TARSGRLQPFADFRARSAQDDLFQPRFGQLQLFFTMRLERLSAFVQSEGILEIHLALLQTRNNGLKLLERRFEAQVFGRLGRAFWGLGNGGTPTVSSFRNAPKPQCTIIAVMVLPKPASCPRTRE